MRSDFTPVHLQEANRKLDNQLASARCYQKEDDEDQVSEERSVQNVSLWKKFLGLFKTNPSEFPEDLYK